MQPVERLFERWRDERDAAALAAVFDRTAPEVWRVARHLSGSRSEADDLLQATFIAAMESAAHWRAEQRLVPWLLGILANKLRMARRRRRPVAIGAAVALTLEDPVRAAERQELRELLQERLAELPEIYRTVLTLQLEHGLTAAEVAHALGRPRATVRSQLHRGLELLRQSLPAGLGPEPVPESSPRMRQIRGAVLAAASGSLGVPTVGIGVTLMMKKLSVLAAVVFAVGMYWAWPGSGSDAPAVGGTSGALAPTTTTPQPTEVGSVSSEPQRDTVVLATTSSGPGTLRVRVVWSDGTPAVATRVCLTPVPAGDWFAQRIKPVDAAGIAEFTELAPGRVQVSSRRGGSVGAAIRAGECTDAELRIPVGIDASGRVLGPDGEPVAGAIVAVGRGREDLLETTRCDGNGRFFVRGLAAQSLLAAFAPGFGGSELLLAKDFADGPRDVRLRSVGGTVTGRVFDADGRPLPGAWVTHGYSTSEATFGPIGSAPPAGTSTVLTDATGAFELHGLQVATPWPLHVGAVGHGSWKGSVRCDGVEAPFVEVHLQRGVELRGVAHAADGTPIRSVVAVTDVFAPGKRLQDPRPSWSRPFVVTGDDGAFVFRNLPPGDLVVSADDNRGRVAGRSFTAMPGDRLEWSPVLSSELSIRGRLVEDGGVPLVGWRIVADAAEGVPTPNSVETDADGVFALRGCVDAPYTLRCYLPGDGWTQAIVEQRGVEPGGAPLQLRAPGEAMPSSFVDGRLGPDQPGGSISVVVVGARSGILLRGPLEPGEEFSIGPMPPGRYALQMQGDPQPGVFGLRQLQALGTVELKTGEHHDLGEIRLAPPGELAVELVTADGRPVERASLTFHPLDVPMGGVGVRIEHGRGSVEVAPGAYLPTFASDGLHVEHAAITVVSGERTPVRMQVMPSVLRHVRFDLTALGTPNRAVATWKKAGVAVQRHAFDFWREVPSTVDVQFTPGGWELELELGDGRVRQFPFVVTADPEGPTLEIRAAR